MRIVIEIDNDARVAQQSAVSAVEFGPAVNAGAAPVTSARSTEAPVASGSADVVDGGAAGGQAVTNGDTGTATALGSVPTDAVDAGPGPQF